MTYQYSFQFGRRYKRKDGTSPVVAEWRKRLVEDSKTWGDKPPSLPQLGRRYGVSDKTIGTVLREHGITKIRAAMKPREMSVLSSIWRNKLVEESKTWGDNPPSQKELGRRYGKSKQCISQVLHAHGIKKRYTRTSHRPRPPLFSRADVEQIVEFSKTVLTTKDVAAKFNRTPDTIRRYVTRYGMKLQCILGSGRKLTDAQITEIRLILSKPWRERGMTIKQIADLFGVTVALITHIASGLANSTRGEPIPVALDTRRGRKKTSLPAPDMVMEP